MKIINELKRRNVFKVASVYLVTTWILLQVVAVIGPALQLPAMFATIITVILGLGFPVVCIFAWAFELTPEGVKLTSDVEDQSLNTASADNKLNSLLVVSLVVALAFIVYRELEPDPNNESNSVSIAVLPFEDFSVNKNQAHLGEGIADTILNDLVNLNEFQVSARTSSFAYQNQKLPISEIGKKLNVDTVLEGSIQESNGQLRIIAQLIRVEDEAHIWSKTMDLSNDNIFVIQDLIAREVVNLLAPSASVAVKQDSEIASEAYNYFLKGQSLYADLSLKSMPKALEYFNKAIEIQPNYLTAHAHIAIAYFMNLGSHYGPLDYKTAFDQAQRHILRVNTSEQSTIKDRAIANAALALFSGEFDHSLDNLSRVFDLQTATAFEIEVLSRLTSYSDSPNTALEFFENVLALNDEQPAIKRKQVQQLTNLGRYEEAEKLLQQYIAESPEFETFYYELALVIESASTKENNRVLEAYNRVFENAIERPASSFQNYYALKHLPLFIQPEQNRQAWTAVEYMQNLFLQDKLTDEAPRALPKSITDKPFLLCVMTGEALCEQADYQGQLERLDQILFRNYGSNLRVIGLKENRLDSWRPLNYMVNGAIILSALKQEARSEALIDKISGLVDENNIHFWVGMTDPFLKAKFLALQNKPDALAELERVVDLGFITTVRFISSADHLVTENIVWDKYRATDEFKRIERKAKQRLSDYRQQLAPVIGKYLSQAALNLENMKDVSVGQ